MVKINPIEQAPTVSLFKQLPIEEVSSSIPWSVQNVIEFFLQIIPKNSP